MVSTCSTWAVSSSPGARSKIGCSGSRTCSAASGSPTRSIDTDPNMPSQARIERDALGYCEHSRDHHRHVWMEFAVPRLGNAPAVFCSRCGVRGVFSLLELEQWHRELDAYWRRRDVNP